MERYHSAAVCRREWQPGRLYGCRNRLRRDLHGRCQPSGARDALLHVGSRPDLSVPQARKELERNRIGRGASNDGIPHGALLLMSSPRLSSSSRPSTRSVVALVRDKRGAAAVEFAVLAPLLTLMLLGTIELARAINIDRVFTQATDTT